MPVPQLILSKPQAQSTWPSLAPLAHCSCREARWWHIQMCRWQAKANLSPEVSVIESQMTLWNWLSIHGRFLKGKVCYGVEGQTRGALNTHVHPRVANHSTGMAEQAEQIKTAEHQHIAPALPVEAQPANGRTSPCQKIIATQYNSIAMATTDEILDVETETKDRRSRCWLRLALEIPRMTHLATIFCLDNVIKHSIGSTASSAP